MTIILLNILSLPVYAEGAPQKASDVPAIQSQSAVLMDAKTGRILYEKNMHSQMYPASLTKIMTGVVAVRLGNPSDTVTVTPEDLKGINSGTASVWLVNGEKLTLSQALYAMFLASANDAAAAIAGHVGGSADNFVKLMNVQAKQLGANDTHFSNPNGLPDKNNLTSAYDMALITKYALTMPDLMKYFGARRYTIAPTNKQPLPRNLETLHKMMKGTRYAYSGVIAGKTGWETMSGHTLVTAAQRNGETLICVVMNTPGASGVYSDTKLLLDYGFTHFSSIVCKTTKQSYIYFSNDQSNEFYNMPETAKPIQKAGFRNKKADTITPVVILLILFIVSGGFLIYRYKPFSHFNRIDY